MLSFYALHFCVYAQSTPNYYDPLWPGRVRRPSLRSLWDTDDVQTSSKCESSPHQIVFRSESIDQKRNLIIFDLDQTILESVEGFHEAVPSKYHHNRAGNEFNALCDPSQDFEFVRSRNAKLDLLLLHKPRNFSIVFRKHFFDVLEYIHTDHSFSADIVMYTRAGSMYAQQVTLGITEIYKTKYHNISDGLFLDTPYIRLDKYRKLYA